MKNSSNYPFKKIIGMAFLTIGAQSAAHAVEAGSVEIHGYGNQDYFHASDNKYLNADRNGTWQNNALALLFASQIDDKSKVWIQLYGTADKMRLDWAFVDYQVNNNLTARAGQIKTPIGLYNEIRDIDYIQMSALKPGIYQEASEFAHEAFRGVGMTLNHDLGSGGLSWDAYAGQTVNFDTTSTIKNRQMAGGRLTYKTPVNGLRFMLSAYNDNKQNDATPPQKSAINAWVLSADYNNNDWDIKAEYAKKKDGLEDKRAKAYYVQTGYTLADKWTPFVRYDYITTDISQDTDPSYFQKSTSVGVTYKVNSNIGMRLENHWNKGYALPVAATDVTAGEGKTNWRMFGASVNFIF